MNKVLPLLLPLLLGALLAVTTTVPAYSAARTEHANVQQETATLRETAAQLPQEQVRSAQLNRAYQDLKGALPDAEAFPEVLDTLQVTARRLGLAELEDITRNVRRSDLPGVAAVDLAFNLTGSYARAEAFVRTVARLPRAYTVNSINFTTSNSAPGQVTAALKVTTYRRDTQTSPAPAPPNTTAPSTPAVTPTPAPGGSS